MINFYYLHFKVTLSSQHSQVATTDESKQKNYKNEQFVFPGARASWINKPLLTMSEDYGSIPIYHVMDNDGNILESSENPNLSKDIVTKMFRDMVFLNTMDKILYESQR